MESCTAGKNFKMGVRRLFPATYFLRFGAPVPPPAPPGNIFGFFHYVDLGFGVFFRVSGFGFRV